MLSLKIRASILTLLTILAFSIFTPAMVFAAPLATDAKDWQHVNGNSWAWNYSPETQITKDNVDQLEVKWLYPLESATTALPAIRAVTTSEGTSTPPIVTGGKVYVTTNFLRTIALDGATGKELWRYNYNINATDLQKRLPLKIGSGHLHGFRYWAAGNALLVTGLACDFYGIDANTGKNSFWVKDLCKDIPGNLYPYSGGIEITSAQAEIATYEKGRLFIFILPGSMHSGGHAGDGRHTTLGINMDTKQIVWRVFSFPPEDVPTKDWALQECSTGWFRDIPCSTVAAKAPQNLEWDWAQPGEKPSIYGGVTANWGQPVVDEDTGTLYTQTGNQGPYTYVGFTPGPRLYGSTIMAIDMSNGKRLWWQQPMPRDMWDYDCNWSGMLIDSQTLGGKVYVKGCKEGRFFVLDTKTGKPIQMIDVINEQYQWGQITKAGTLEGWQGGIKYHTTDPLSNYDMKVIKAPENSTYCGVPCEQYPAWANGIFATDMSYDPTTGTVYHYANGLQATIFSSGGPDQPGWSPDKPNFYVGKYRLEISNTTLVARDLATGKVKWTKFYPLYLQRSAMTITPDMVVTGFSDGYLRFFDKNTGQTLREMNLGSYLQIAFTTGQDAKGNQLIYSVLTQGSRAHQLTAPGTVVGIGLSSSAAKAATTTMTTTATTTAVSTTTTTSISTTTSATTITTTSATTSTITTTSATTVTSTSATTITSNAPAQTTTVVSSVTESTGLPSEVTYAAVGVAVIALIAAAVLAMRKK